MLKHFFVNTIIVVFAIIVNGFFFTLVVSVFVLIDSFFTLIS
jgi:hypothetical protein